MGIVDYLVNANRVANPTLVRTALKLATGAGRTMPLGSATPCGTPA
jgi:hypothetical protein